MMAENALERIEFELQGIAEEDLTKAEKNILAILKRYEDEKE